MLLCGADALVRAGRPVPLFARGNQALRMAKADEGVSPDALSYKAFEA